MFKIGDRVVEVDRAFEVEDLDLPPGTVIGVQGSEVVVQWDDEDNPDWHNCEELQLVRKWPFF